MKLNAVLAAVMTLGVAVASHAATTTVVTHAYENSTALGTGAGADTGLDLLAGQSFTVTTDANQTWYGAQPWDGNYGVLSTNADGAVGTGWTLGLNGVPTTYVGALVAVIGNEYRVVGSGQQTFAAWASGELYFEYADINFYDNSGTMTSTVTTAAAVPEPANVALLTAGLGLLGFMARRRSAK